MRHVKIILYLYVCVFLLSCTSSLHDNRITIQNSEVSSIWIACKSTRYIPGIENKWYKVHPKEYTKIVSEINQVKKGEYADTVYKRGFANEEVVENIKIVMKNQETLVLPFRFGAFLWRDSVYKTNLELGELDNHLCIKCYYYSLPLDSVWSRTIVRYGCMLGGQHVENGHFGGGQCVMTSSPFWAEFFDRNKEELIPFLLEKFSSKEDTDIHICPFSDAEENELAVYCLHKLYVKNWYNLEGFQEYKNKKITGSDGNHQLWLREILADDTQREALKEAWRKEIEKQHVQ